MTNTELKQIRLAMNLRQKDLAKLLHVNYMTISRWENELWPIPEDKAELLGYKWREFMVNNPYTGKKLVMRIKEAPFVGNIPVDKIQRAIDSVGKK